MSGFFVKVLSRIANGLTANDGTGDGLRSGGDKINDNYDVIVDTVNALAASQNAGMIGYATKAAMVAVSPATDGVLARVMQDATSANNTVYRWDLSTSAWVVAKDYNLDAITTATAAATATSLTNAGNSAISAAAASASATAAATASDAAQLSAGVYADTTTGLAATTTGKYFSVPSADATEYLILYKNNAGAAVEVKRYPSKVAVSNLSDDYAATINKTSWHRSGYWGGIMSASGRLGIGFRKSDGRTILGYGGDIAGRVDVVESSLSVVTDDRTGVLLGFKTIGGRLLAHFDKYTGRLKISGRDVLSEVDSNSTRITAVEAAVVNPLQDFPTTNWACWGDSLTAPGSSGDWPSKLAMALGVSVYNGGWGGQGYKQIAARQGAAPCLMTVTGGMIPASGSVAVTTSGYYPASNGGSYIGTLAGIVGTYARAADGLSATFTRSASGAATASPASAVFASLDGASNRDRVVTILSGRNSFQTASPGEVIASIRAMIDYLTPRVKRVIVMEIPPADTETTGTANRIKLDALNDAVKAAFPDYWLDISSWLRTPAAATAASITFTSQDNTDIANGITPTTFRTVGGTTDGIHWVNGGAAIAYRVQLEANTRGWIA